MTITNQELQNNFSEWCSVYAYLKDPNNKPDFLLNNDQGVYSIKTWSHTSPKPTITDLLNLSTDDMKSYRNSFHIDEFLSQANDILKSGYLLLWSRLRTLEGTTFQTNDEVLSDLRTNLLTFLNNE